MFEKRNAKNFSFSPKTVQENFTKNDIIKNTFKIREKVINGYLFLSTPFSLFCPKKKKEQRNFGLSFWINKNGCGGWSRLQMVCGPINK